MGPVATFAHLSAAAPTPLWALRLLGGEAIEEARQALAEALDTFAASNFRYAPSINGYSVAVVGEDEWCLVSFFGGEWSVRTLTRTHCFVSHERI